MTANDRHRDAGGAPASVPFVQTGGYPTRGGNLLVPWIDGVPAFRRICEAIEAARRSVWATVTFMWPSFEMPDGRGSALDLLERVARRGVDVRLIFWRPDDLHRYSLFGNGELNVAFSSGAVVRALRAALFDEHLGVDTLELTDSEALLLFQRVARDNRERHDRGDARWQGMAIRLDLG